MLSGTEEGKYKNRKFAQTCTRVMVTYLFFNVTYDLGEKRFTDSYLTRCFKYILIYILCKFIGIFKS